MNCMVLEADPRSGLLQKLNLARFPDGSCQAEANDFFFLPTPEARHQQNAGFDPFFSQRNGFVQRSHAQPGRAFFFKRLRALNSTMSVCVCLHDSADGDTASDVVPDGAVVLANVCKGDLGAGRTRCRALRYFNGGHFRDYSSRPRRSQVTAVPLLRVELRSIRQPRAPVSRTREGTARLGPQTLAV